MCGRPHRGSVRHCGDHARPSRVGSRHVRAGLSRVDRGAEVIAPAGTGSVPAAGTRLRRLGLHPAGLRAILIRFLAVGGGLLAGLLVTEVLLRMFGAAPTDGVTTVTE